METLKTLILFVHMALLAFLVPVSYFQEKRIEKLEAQTTLQMRILLQHEISINGYHVPAPEPPKVDKDA